jgi:hypothetical protein
MAQAPDPQALISKLSVSEAWNFLPKENKSNRYSVDVNESKTGFKPSTSSSTSSSISSLHHDRTHQYSRQNQQRTKKWHFVCASPDVATPPGIFHTNRLAKKSNTIGSVDNIEENSTNLDMEPNDCKKNRDSNIEPLAIQKTAGGSSTPLGIPDELQRLITLPALSASASEESLRAFASHAAVAMRCIEFTLRHTNSQNIALRLENDKLIGTNIELQERLVQLDNQLSQIYKQNVSRNSDEQYNAIDHQHDSSTQDKISELTRRSIMYHRGSVELKQKFDFQRQEYENNTNVLREELDKLSRQLAQQRIIYESRIRNAESNLENGMVTVANNNKEIADMRQKYTKLKQMYLMEKEDLLASQNTISLLKSNLHKTKLDLAQDRHHLKQMSNDTSKVESKLFEAETKIRSLMEENENLLSGASTPWADKHKQYQQELLKTKTLLNERQEYYEAKINNLTDEVVFLKNELKEKYNNVALNLLDATGNQTSSTNNNNNNNNHVEAKQFADTMTQTSLLNNDSTDKRATAYSIVTTQTIGASNEPTNNEQDSHEPTSNYYQLLLKEQEERFNMYKEELMFNIERYKEDIREMKEQHASDVTKIKQHYEAKEIQLKLALADAQNDLTKNTNAHQNAIDESIQCQLGDPTARQQQQQMHYEDLLSKAHNDAQRLNAEYLNKIHELEHDKTNGLNLIVSKFTESDIRKDKIIEQLKLGNEDMATALQKATSAITKPAVATNSASTMTTMPRFESSGTNTTGTATKTTAAGTTTKFRDDSNTELETQMKVLNDKHAKYLHELTTRHQNELQNLQNGHEKNLQITVAKTKAGLRNNFRAQILQFEKDYDSKINEIKNDLKIELTNKHAIEMNRSKEKYVREIKMLKVEMKNLLLKHDADLKQALRSSTSSNSINGSVGKMQLRRNVSVRRSYEPRSVSNNKSRSLKNTKNNNSYASSNNKRLQEKLRLATIRLEKLEKLVELENLKVPPTASPQKTSKTRYEAEIERIKMEHRIEIKQLMEEKSLMYKDGVTSMKLQHEKAMVELKTKHMQKMVEIKEAFAENQEQYLREKSDKFKTTIIRQQEHIEKLQKEKQNLNQNMIQLRKSITSLQISNSQNILIGSNYTNDAETRHSNNTSKHFETPKRSRARPTQHGDDSALVNISKGNSEDRFVTPTRSNGNMDVRKSAPTPGGGKLLYPELLSPEDTDKLVQKVLLRRSLNNNKADSYNGKTPDRSTSRSNHKRAQPFTIEEIESMNATDTLIEGGNNNMVEELETLSFEERLKRVGAKKISPLNINTMTTNNFTSNVSDEDAFSPIHLVGNKNRTSDMENDSIGFKLQSIDPMMLQRRSSSSNSSSSTRYAQNP